MTSQGIVCVSYTLEAYSNSSIKVNVPFYGASTLNGLAVIRVPNVSPSHQRNCPNGGQTKPDCVAAQDE